MDSAAAGVEVAASRDEEEAAPLVSAAGEGRRGAGAASETRDLHVLSSAFFFVFLAYHAAQNLQSTVNTDENLGSISLGLLYASFTAFSVVGSPVVRRMGSRSALMLGTSGYLLFIAANLAPNCMQMQMDGINCQVQESSGGSIALGTEPPSPSACVIFRKLQAGYQRWGAGQGLDF